MQLAQKAGTIMTGAATNHNTVMATIRKHHPGPSRFNSYHHERPSPPHPFVPEGEIREEIKKIRGQLDKPHPIDCTAPSLYYT